MINKGNRQQGSSYFISSDNSLKLERVPLNEKHFLENWLQKLRNCKEIKYIELA
jgi:hypothetical protein